MTGGWTVTRPSAKSTYSGIGIWGIAVGVNRWSLVDWLATNVSSIEVLVFESDAPAIVLQIRLFGYDVPPVHR